MTTKTSGNYLSYRDWFRNVITEDVILCGVSALEYLEMFNGFVDEDVIEVYALSRGNYSNINYNIIDRFDTIDTVCIDGVRCTSFTQTINDMLSDLDNADLWALTEALSNYYYSHNDSFNNLKIKSSNVDAFESVKQDAIAYYNGGY